MKKVYLRFDATAITRESLAELEEIFAKYEGGKTVYLDLLDHEEISGVTLLARNNKVNVSNEFLKEVKEIPGYEGFAVNKSDLNRRLHRLKLEQEKMKQSSSEIVEN